MHASIIIGASAVAALAGCEPGVPASPSWQVDIMPIFAANCVRCHGTPAIGNGPPELRLDSFEDTQVGFLEGGEPQVLLGARTYGMTSAARVALEEAPMPPRFPLEPWQIETLQRWAGGDEQPVRGEPRPDNQQPALVVRELGRDATTLTLGYSLHDPDGDLVVGQLCAGDGAACAFLAPLQTGEDTLTIDLTAHPPPLSITARLDDGAGFADRAALTVEAP